MCEMDRSIRTYTHVCEIRFLYHSINTTLIVLHTLLYCSTLLYINTLYCNTIHIQCNTNYDSFLQKNSIISQLWDFSKPRKTKLPKVQRLLTTEPYFSTHVTCGLLVGCILGLSCIWLSYPGNKHSLYWYHGKDKRSRELVEKCKEKKKRKMQWFLKLLFTHGTWQFFSHFIKQWNYMTKWKMGQRTIFIP